MVPNTSNSSNASSSSSSSSQNNVTSSQKSIDNAITTVYDDSQPPKSSSSLIDNSDLSFSTATSNTTHAAGNKITSTSHDKSSTNVSLPSINIQNQQSPSDLNTSDKDVITHLNSPLSPQEIDHQRTLLKEKNLDEIKQQCSTLISELEGNQHPEVVIKKHIQQLKKYNELKDIALELISMIADQRQVRTTDILNEMKVELGDDSI